MKSMKSKNFTDFVRRTVGELDGMGYVTPSKQYGWLDFKTKKIMFIYPSRICVEICSPDGFKRATERKEGRIVEVLIIPNIKDKQ